MMGNSGSHFRWPASLFGAVVFGRCGKRGLVLFGAHAFRTFGALCLFLALGMSAAQKALADDGKESLAPQIVQEMQCGSHKVVITCGRIGPQEKRDPLDIRVCVHNTLKFIDVAGNAHPAAYVPKYKHPDSYGWTPSYMRCGEGRDGAHYIEVEYDDCCGASSVFYVLFSETGSFILKRPVLRDDESGEVKRYNRIVKKQGIHFYSDK